MVKNNFDSITEDFVNRINFEGFIKDTYIFNRYPEFLSLELSNKTKRLIIDSINNTIVDMDFLLIEELKRKTDANR